MSFWGRRRDIAVLITVVVLQLILLGYQVRRDDDMTLLRAWSVGAVSPVNKLLHSGFSSVSDVWNHYFWLVGAQRENEDLQAELDRLRLENDDLRRDVQRFGREQDLVEFQERIASETVLAEVIGGGANPQSREIILSLGRRAGVKPGMALLTAKGIVGKVQASYPGSALALLINDPESGVGVVLGESRVRGVMKGQGAGGLLIDYVAHEVPVSIGETIYTSGDDRVFPKGLRVGRVTRLEDGTDFREIYVEPFAALDRLDEVMVITAGVHEDLPPRRRPQISETLLPAPAEEEPELIEDEPGVPTPAPTLEDGEKMDPNEPDPTLTDADRLKQRYRAVADAQDVTIGHSNPSGATPDFNLGHPSSTPIPEPPPADAPIEGSPE